MAGAKWHFYTANRTIESLQNKLESNPQYRCIVDHRPLFLAGVQGPDFNFYPGGDGKISDLAHGEQPADLARSLLKNSETEQERAFAYGWLMHVATDIVTHPLVNRLITKYFPRQTRNGTNPYAYLLGHHRVEWGIDLDFYQNKKLQSYIPDSAQVLASALELTSLVSRTYKEMFDYDLKAKDWKGSINGMIKFLRIFEKAWHYTGRVPDQNVLKQMIKSLLFQTVVSPIAKLAALRNPENGAGVLLPIEPEASDMEAVLDHTEKVVPDFDRYLDNDFVDMPNSTGLDDKSDYAD